MFSSGELTALLIDELDGMKVLEEHKAKLINCMAEIHLSLKRQTVLSDSNILMEQLTATLAEALDDRTSLEVTAETNLRG